MSYDKALYLDMGSWRDGYYRTADGLHDIMTAQPTQVKHNKTQTNYLVARKR